MRPAKSRRKRGKARRNRECGTKQPLTEEKARALAAHLTGRLGVYMRAYRCRFCYLPSGRASWHVGHAQRFSTRLGA